MSEPRYKAVNGELVPLSPEELAAREAEEAAWAVANSPATLHNRMLDEQIRALETAQLLPRVTREVHLAFVVREYMRDTNVDAATAIARLTDSQHSDYNLGFTKLKAFDDQIKTLRARRV